MASAAAAIHIGSATPQSFCIDIGVGRSRLLSMHDQTMTLSTLEPQPGGGFAAVKEKSITLPAKAVKILHLNIEDINQAVDELQKGLLVTEFKIYLGEFYWLTITPDVFCVSIRKYYQAEGGYRPGRPGFTFKISEYRNMYQNWLSIYNLVADVKTCSHAQMQCFEANCTTCKY
jgi:hypothetical protein